MGYNHQVYALGVHDCPQWIYGKGTQIFIENCTIQTAMHLSDKDVSHAVNLDGLSGHHDQCEMGH